MSDQRFICWPCNGRIQWDSYAAGDDANGFPLVEHAPLCDVCGEELSNVGLARCNVCGRELYTEEEDEIGMCNGCFL